MALDELTLLMRELRIEEEMRLSRHEGLADDEAWLRDDEWRRAPHEGRGHEALIEDEGIEIDDHETIVEIMVVIAVMVEILPIMMEIPSAIAEVTALHVPMLCA